MEGLSLEEISNLLVTPKSLDLWIWYARKSYDDQWIIRDIYTRDEWVLKVVREKFYQTDEGRKYLNERK